MWKAIRSSFLIRPWFYPFDILPSFGYVPLCRDDTYSRDNFIGIQDILLKLENPSRLKMLLQVSVLVWTSLLYAKNAMMNGFFQLETSKFFHLLRIVIFVLACQSYRRRKRKMIFFKLMAARKILGDISQDTCWKNTPLIL